jgi:hypothetical protein
MKGLLYGRLHAREVIVRKAHPADVEQHADGGAITKMTLIPFPKSLAVHGFSCVIKIGVVFYQVADILS